MSWSKLVMVVLGVAALSGAALVVFGVQRHSVYMVARGTSLMVVCIGAMFRADVILQGIKANPYFSILIGTICLLSILLLLFAENIIRILAWLMGNPNAPTPF